MACDDERMLYAFAPTLDSAAALITCLEETIETQPSFDMAANQGLDECPEDEGFPGIDIRGGFPGDPMTMQLMCTSWIQTQSPEMVDIITEFENNPPLDNPGLAPFLQMQLPTDLQNSTIKDLSQ